MAEFGTIISTPMVEDAVEQAVRAWMPAYVGEALAQAGHGRFDLPNPMDVIRASDADWLAGDQLALAIIVSPGTLGDASRLSRDLGLSMVWDIRVTTMVNFTDRAWARRAAGIYAAAVGTALMHKGLDALPEANVLLLGETVGAMGRVGAGVDSRTIIGGEARLSVELLTARSLHGGPDTPPPTPDDRPPGTPDPTAETFVTTIHAEPIE